MEDLFDHLPQLWENLVQFVQTNPWLAPIASVTVALLTIGRRVIRRFGQRALAKIEEKLNPKADRLADQLVDLPETLVSFRRFQSRYYQSLVYALRDFRVQGLKTKGPFVLDLQKVFVPLRVAAGSLDQIPSDMIQPESTGESLSIWQILAAIATQPAFRRMVVLGPPGSGKSTLVEHLTLTYAQKLQRQQHRQAPTLIPILLYLRDLREAVAIENPPTLPTLLEQQESIRALNPPSQWFETRLQQGRCLVMLDGLDEVADCNQRQQVSRWVAQQMQAYPKSCFILTSRPFGYKTAPLEQVTSIEVQPFNLKQMQQFVKNWYLQNEVMSRLGKDDPGVRQIAKSNAANLIGRIKNTPSLAAMALNPLLLTMIATVHCYRGALPGRRVELYGEICDVLLGRRQDAKGTPDRLTSAQKQTVLQALALKGMQRNTREFKLVTACLLIRQRLEAVAGREADPEQFLKLVENVSGLLVEREQGVYEFAHKSFQEFLAAVQIKEIGQELLLSRQVDNPWWEETIRLYAAQGDASYLIQAALDRNTVGALAIAYDCLEEGLRVEPKVRQALEDALERGLESSKAEIFKLAVEVKLSRRLKNLLRTDDNTEIDTRYITCAEYQLFIDEKRYFNPPSFNQSDPELKQPTGENRQPDHWLTDRFPPGDASRPIVGVRAGDAEAFCQWLTERSSALGDTFLEDGSTIFVGESKFRLPNLAEAREHPILLKEHPISEQTIGFWYEHHGKKTVEIEPISNNEFPHLSSILASDLNEALKLAFNKYSTIRLFRHLEATDETAQKDMLKIDLNSVLNPPQATEFATDSEIFGVLELAFNVNYVPRNENARDEVSRLINGFKFIFEHMENRGYTNNLNSAQVNLLLIYSLYEFLSNVYLEVSRQRQRLPRGLTRKECRKISDKYSEIRDRVLNLYAFFVVLNQRRSQQLPIWEGIRIIREKVRN
jgi:hypothetical protein